MKFLSRQALAIVTFFVLLLVVNCQKVDDLQQPEQTTPQQDQDVVTRTVSSDEIPHVIQFIKTKSNDQLRFDFPKNEDNYRGSGGDPHESNLTITQAMQDEIVMVTMQGKSNYAFDMTTNNSSYILNLVYVEHIDGDYFYFAKYVPSTETIWKGDIESFSGTQYIYSDTGEYKTKAFYSNGTRGIYPCECPDGDGGSGGGAGGSVCLETAWWKCDWRGSLHASQAECTCPSGQNPCGGSYVFVEECQTASGDKSIQSSDVNKSGECFCDDGLGDHNDGGGGGNPAACVGSEPCNGDFEQYDENCNCEVVLNPIEPVNPNSTEYVAARKAIKSCIGTYGADFLDNNSGAVMALEAYLEANDCTAQTADFSEAAIDTWDDGGEVDFEDEIIIHNSFENHERLKCVYDKFKSGNNTISEYLENFLPDNAVAHLNLKADSNFKVNQPQELWGAGAIRDPPIDGANGSNVASYNINIIFNTDPSLASSAQNFPTIILAQELIHEMVHAEMYRKLLECAQLPHVNYQNYTVTQWRDFVYTLRYNYEGLYDYYSRYFFNNENPSATQHNAMASHYRDMMVEALRDFDNSQHSNDFYNALAWIGLKGTEAWNDPSVNQSVINSIITNAINNETHDCTN